MMKNLLTTPWMVGEYFLPWL